MAARGGDLERPLGGFLALDVSEVRPRRPFFFGPGFGRREDLGALEMIDQLHERGRRQHVEPLDPGGFASRRGRTNEPEAPGMGMDGGGQHAGDRAHAAIER